MIKILAAALTASICLSSYATADDTTDTTDRKIDTEKYCYYADLTYSEGAIMHQSGIMTKCVRAKDSKFSSTTPDNVLVWQKQEGL